MKNEKKECPEVTLVEIDSCAEIPPTKVDIKKSRLFGGKTTGFQNKREGNFEKKHLRAYIKGHKRFRFGYNQTTGKPNWYNVVDIWQ